MQIPAIDLIFIVRNSVSSLHLLLHNVSSLFYKTETSLFWTKIFVSMAAMLDWKETEFGANGLLNFLSKCPIGKFMNVMPLWK